MCQFLFTFLFTLALLLPAESQRITLSTDVELYPLTQTIWRHVSYLKMEQYGLVPANGLVVVSGAEAALIDTPWTPEQTAVLLDWFKKEKGVSVVLGIPGHYHEDCMGGFPELHRRGITTLALALTGELAVKRGLQAPNQIFSGLKKVTLGQRYLELFFPGGGHTVDNIVVWMSDENVLFGGCLIKSLNSKDLGYTDEADLATWPNTLNVVKKRYTGALIVVPGHGEPGGLNLIDHTLDLLEKK
jgi:metallo-beta-lactamase class B